MPPRTARTVPSDRLTRVHQSTVEPTGTGVPAGRRRRDAPCSTPGGHRVRRRAGRGRSSREAALVGDRPTSGGTVTGCGPSETCTVTCGAVGDRPGRRVGRGADHLVDRHRRRVALRLDRDEAGRRQGGGGRGLGGAGTGHGGHGQRRVALGGDDRHGRSVGGAWRRAWVPTTPAHADVGV